ncbi:hypothetical protein KQX54_020642 [Cotesia glomerata]|uniref:Uncharacterized protein n=1 Tax=Cotesia glomerata TaxID=32391 RepID=A0AAV7I261_COTGL|nr:hypothetical protein KQX54_020642 [Cotesia glomerata]
MPVVLLPGATPMGNWNSEYYYAHLHAKNIALSVILSLSMTVDPYFYDNDRQIHLYEEAAGGGGSRKLVSSIPEVQPETNRPGSSSRQRNYQRSSNWRPSNAQVYFSIQ